MNYAFISSWQSTEEALIVSVQENNRFREVKQLVHMEELNPVCWAQEI